MNDRILSWEEAVLWLKNQSDRQELVHACFYDDPPDKVFGATIIQQNGKLSEGYSPMYPVAECLISEQDAEFPRMLLPVMGGA